MDAILPLRLSGDYQEHDLDRARILVHSLDHFWEDQEPLRLIVLAPEQDLARIRAALAPRRLRLAALREELLLPDLAGVPRLRGWFRQMVLKLAAHQLVPGDFYLTLDADLVCTRPISRRHLFAEGKALTDWEPRETHPEWWQGSAAALGLPGWPAGPGLSVTPELLSTQIVRALERALHPAGGAGAWDRLLRLPGLWSEYSLYTLFAEQAGLLHRFHLDNAWMQANRRALRAAGNLWYAAGWPDWNPADAFAPGARGFFLVAQSSARVAPRLIWERLAPHIPGCPF